jgi:hypothetical protein
MIYIFNGMTFAMLLFIVASGLNIALGFWECLIFRMELCFCWEPM